MTSQSTPLRFGGVDLKTNITEHLLKSLRAILCKHQHFQNRGGQVTSPILLKFGM
jgi:hypothetical protein